MRRKRQRPDPTHPAASRLPGCNLVSQPNSLLPNDRGNRMWPRTDYRLHQRHPIASVRSQPVHLLDNRDLASARLAPAVGGDERDRLACEVPSCASKKRGQVWRERRVKSPACLREINVEGVSLVGVSRRVSDLRYPVRIVEAERQPPKPKCEVLLRDEVVDRRRYGQNALPMEGLV